MAHKDITIVAACVDFDDYLSRVIESWLKFNPKEIIIVTAEDDNKTKDLCRKYNLTVVPVPRREEWIRGYYINKGLRKVKSLWTLILDADCWLPHLVINCNSLGKHLLYGLPITEMTPQNLEDFKVDNRPRNKIRKRAFGTGCFQLFYTHTQRSKDRWYNEELNVLPNGKGASIQFAKQWKKIIKLPYDFVVCISNNDNRHGRKTCKMPRETNTKANLINKKLEKFKKFTNAEIGIVIYEK